MTPLHLATKRRNYEIIDILLHFKADPHHSEDNVNYISKYFIE